MRRIARFAALCIVSGGLILASQIAGCARQSRVIRCRTSGSEHWNPPKPWRKWHRRRPPALSYLELIPGCKAQGEALPLVVALHGIGDGAERTSEFFDDFPISARVILPLGPLQVSGGRGWSRHRMLDGKPEALNRDLDARASELARLIAYVYQREPSLGAPIVIGFSQGAALALALAKNHPGAAGEIYPVAGALPETARFTNESANRAGSPRPPTIRASPTIRAMNGARDSIIPLDYALRTARAMRQNGYDIALRVFPEARHTMSYPMHWVSRAWITAAVERAYRAGPPPDRPKSSPARSASRDFVLH